MSRIIIAAVVIAVVVTVYAVIDCAMSDASRARVLKKSTWLFVILLVPIVGPVLWILVGQGRVLKAEPEAAPAAPDDDETFLRSIGIDDGHDETIRRLEEELRALDDEAARDGRRPGDDVAPKAADEAARSDGDDAEDDDDPHGPPAGGHHTPGQRPDHDDGTGGAGGATRA
ncbi:PLDc_N domain-containing protein [Pseudoclavibacter chungangensis]|uniref:PLDc_N domain-containing protein n=1 Tax=Pseudoclavibacter chungangensis TaxID=587635 RepID=A0A7J5BQR4_9MICO|nr:PLD nuclease N-terminal domain-containing protein [Pseudoclavibacter chungangensis]KAB1656662.1 PLDc_N domain-containing protein [Pseudoclavibacter chungangensis]NYJ67888.1 hypothetical protein [Pseudoclavibacter chungangensis]